MKVVYRPEAALRSPCYGCGALGSKGYPDCADVCAEMAVYRRQAGLKETTEAESGHVGVRKSRDIENLRGFLRGERERFETDMALARKIGISEKALRSFIKGTSQEMLPGYMARARAYQGVVDSELATRK